MAECPWNGCNRIRGIVFPTIARIKKGFYTGDDSWNRVIIVGFEPFYITWLRAVGGSNLALFIKTLNMGEWEGVEFGGSRVGYRHINGVKLLSDGFELNNGGASFDINRVGYGYDWIAFGD